MACLLYTLWDPRQVFPGRQDWLSWSTRVDSLGTTYEYRDTDANWLLLYYCTVPGRYGLEYYLCCIIISEYKRAQYFWPE